MNSNSESHFIHQNPFVEIVSRSLYTTKLDGDGDGNDSDITELNKIALDEFYQSSREKKKNYIYSSVLSKKSSSYQPILLKAKELLVAAGFQGLTNKSIIELYSYNMDGGTVASKFIIHADNEAYSDSDVVTCIFYTQKDSSIIDGNLEYYEDITLKKGWFSGLFTKYKNARNLLMQVM
jgi:hypothetical protein